MTGYQIVGLLCAFLFFAGTIGADIVFGQLLKRQYLTARTQWERDLQPMWWSWQPPGASLSKLRYRRPRSRWLLSTPPWIRQDKMAQRLHLWQQILALVAFGSWATAIFIGVTGRYSN